MENRDAHVMYLLRTVYNINECVHHLSVHVYQKLHAGCWILDADGGGDNGGGVTAIVASEEWWRRWWWRW